MKPGAVVVFLDDLRGMLREELGARGRRDQAVAEAVAAWYTRQHPELLLLLEQPNLAGIIASIRPAPAPGTEQRRSPDFDKIIDAIHREESPAILADLAAKLKDCK